MHARNDELDVVTLVIYAIIMPLNYNAPIKIEFVLTSYRFIALIIMDCNCQYIAMPLEISSENLLEEFKADINGIKQLVEKEGQNESVKKVGEELIDCADKLIQQQKSNPASITEEDIKKHKKSL